MVHGKNRIPYRIDRRLTGLAGPDYDATISFGLPFEPEGSQHGKSRRKHLKMGGRLVRHFWRLIFQLSEVSVPRRLFEGVLDRIGRLSPAPS